jgi:hypothetical protein
MRSILWTWFACIVFWSLFGACVDQPPPPPPPLARFVAVWDPTACGDPHRVAIELTDDNGDALSRSAPCTVGMVQLDVPHLGDYRGRAYGWVLGGEIRGDTELMVHVDQPIVRWELPVTP